MISKGAQTVRYTFKFKLFSGKVQMFSEAQMGIVVEKEPDVVCVYGTDAKNQEIFCAVPLCHPKFLKGAEYTVDFCESQRARVSVGDLRIIIDFGSKKCANNKALKCFGSNSWGENVQIDWSELA